MDLAIIQALHRLVTTNPLLFQTCLFMTERLPWVISATILVALWFTGKPDDRAQAGELTQTESRRRALLIAAGAVTIFIIVRMLSEWIARPSPLESLVLSAPVDPRAWADIVSANSRSRSFPADQVAFWFAIVGGLWRHNRRTGIMAAAGAFVLGAVRVGLGFAWASDVLAGAVLGILASVLVFALRPRLAWFTNPTVEIYKTFPAIAYGLSLLFLLDLTHALTWQFGAIASFLNIRGGP